MASGFNDFPRASHPTSQEYHIDLRCWMTLASGVMAKIAQLLRGMNTKYHITGKVGGLAVYHCYHQTKFSPPIFHTYICSTAYLLKIWHENNNIAGASLNI